MNPCMSIHRQQGFTMVELVMVIVIGGILAIGSVQFIGQATQGYSDAADRQQLATIGWIASEKMSRELRNAVPNSVRVNVTNTCVEFIPVIGGSHYLTLPGETPTTLDSFTAVESGVTNAALNNTRIAVYPTNSSVIYGGGNPGSLSGVVSSISTASNIDTISLGSAFTFLTDSPERRFYFTQNPVTYCIVGSQLNRYSGYGFGAAANPQIIINKISSGSFAIAPATLTRNAIVALNFTLQNGATQTVDQEVQIRNVP